MGPNDAQHVMARKWYVRATRTHKPTIQALWQILPLWLYTYLDGVDATLRADFSDVCTSIDTDHITQMVDKLTPDRFQHPTKEFAAT